MAIKKDKEYTIGFVVCPTDQLKKVCLENDFLRHATIAQCSKIFNSNCIEISLKEGHYPSLYEVISMIWLCSDQDYNTIAKILISVNNDYLLSISDPNTVNKEVVA